MEILKLTQEQFKVFQTEKLKELLKLNSWDKNSLWEVLMCHAVPVESTPFIDMEKLYIPLQAIEKYSFDARLDKETANSALDFLNQMKEQGLYEKVNKIQHNKTV